MIDWIFKLPDFLIGFALVAIGWYGFNYAVLAERAMAKDIEKIIIPTCVAALTSEERRQFIPDVNLSELLGMPELEQFERAARALGAPILVSPAEKFARCECTAWLMAVRTDYAIHTASFRIIAPDTSARLTREVVRTVVARDCVAAD